MTKEAREKADAIVMAWVSGNDKTMGALVDLIAAALSKEEAREELLNLRSRIELLESQVRGLTSLMSYPVPR